MLSEALELIPDLMPSLNEFRKSGATKEIGYDNWLKLANLRQKLTNQGTNLSCSTCKVVLMNELIEFFNARKYNW